MSSKSFSQEQKMTILKSVAKIVVKEAADIAGGHYTQVSTWRRQLKSMGIQAFLDYKPSYPRRGINRFERYLQNERIDHTHARPHPQTLGKVEACNRRIKTELLDQQYFSTLHEAQSALDNWVEHYNYKRSHQGIGGLLTPAERFHAWASQVSDTIDKNIDIADKSCFTSSVLERSQYCYGIGRQNYPL